MCQGILLFGSFIVLDVLLSEQLDMQSLNRICLMVSHPGLISTIITDVLCQLDNPTIKTYRLNQVHIKHSFGKGA